MVNKILASITLTLVFLSVTPSVLSHSGAHPIRFVSESGTDDGVCNNAKRPCKSIAYAVNQSSKGDVVRVSKGNYTVQGMDIFYLLSDMVEIQGGYSKDFRAREATKFLTTIIGLPGEYKKKLDRRGFNLLLDTKEFDISLSKKDRNQLALYKKMTEKVEGPAECINGLANDYQCHNIDLVSHIPLNEFSSNPNSANDIWGHVDLNNNNEYALIGLSNATAIVNVSDPENPVQVASIGGRPSTWRDIKVYQYFDISEDRHRSYAYVTTDKANQGMQIIDLNNLPQSATLVRTMTDFFEAHNVYISNLDYSTNTALTGNVPSIYVSGSNLRTGDEVGSYQVYSLDNPSNPQIEANSGSGAGYIHDAASFVISDNRTSSCAPNHNPCDILIDYSEFDLDIWDITDKANPTKLSNVQFSTSDYIHSGWWSEDKMTVFIQNEGDERSFGLRTTMQALDISDLTNPQIIGTYTGQTNAIDHNGFTLGDYYYMSNYRRGLSVIDVSDPTNMVDVAFFDTFSIPEENSANFNGAWGTYPFLPSGNILVSDIEYGLFVLKLNENDGDFPDSSGGNSGGNTGGGNTGSGNGGSSSSSGGGSIPLVLIIVMFFLRYRR